jgi:hypothetical protein
MLPMLRDPRGKPAAPMRLLALAVVVGMLLIAAPALVVLLRWTRDLLF